MDQDAPCARFSLTDAGRAGLILMAVMLAGAVLIGRLPLSATTAGVISGFLVQAGLAGGVVSVMTAKALSWSALFGLHRDRIRTAVLYGLCGCVLIIPALLVVGGAWNKLLSLAGVTIQDQPVIQWFTERRDPAFRSLFLFQALITAPLSEEFFFRGLLERAFRQTCAPVNAALLTALLFALFHAHLPSVLPLFVMSLGLSWIYQSSRSLLAAMVMHAAYNGFNVLWLLLAPPAG